MTPINTAINEIVAQGVMTYPDLMKRTREREISRKRWEVWKLLIEKGFTQSEIARRFSYSTTTVHYAIKHQRLTEEFEERRSKIIKF